MTLELYPSGQITPLGEDILNEGTIPHIAIVNADRTRVYYLMGGLAPQALGVTGQDGIVLREHPVGLAPPLKHLVSAGARDDGVVHGATLYDPLEIEFPLVAGASTARGLSRVVSTWRGSWRRNRTLRCEWITPDTGYWWCELREHRASRDRASITPRLALEQNMDWVAQADFPFWQSVPSLSTFKYTYAAGVDTFNRAAANDLGADWEQDYLLGVAGVCGTDGAGAAVLKGSGSAEREVVNRYKPVTTTTDNFVSEVKTGGKFPWPSGGYLDLWGRMGVTAGAWNGSGVRARIGPLTVKISRFNTGTETVLFEQLHWMPTFWAEDWRFVGDGRRFKVFRGATEVLNRAESGTGSVMNSTHRSCGFGQKAENGGILPQIIPPGVDRFSMGDNTTAAQSGFLTLTNIGTEDGYWRMLVHGPGMFYFGNGPDSQQYIEFGPLTEGQQVLVTTRPRLRTIVDITPNPLPGQVLTPSQQVVEMLVKMAAMGPTPPMLEWVKSMFGIDPPQDALYTLLKGRFTRPIPGVEQPRDAVTRNIAVKVTGGNANTRIVAALTPLRTWPE